MPILCPHSEHLNGGWYAGVPVRNFRICQQQLFLNRLPFKFSLAATVFSNTEDPFDKTCRWKEFGEA